MTLLTDLRAAIENCRACEQDATADLMERALVAIEELNAIINELVEDMTAKEII